MRVSRFLIPACLALSLHATRPTLAGPPEPIGPVESDPVAKKERLEKARELYRQGLDAYKKKDWTVACDRFVASWAIKEHYQIAGNLGACSMKLERYRDAAKFITIFLRELPKGETPDSRTSAEADLAVAAKKVGVVRLSIFEAAMPPSVWIDGQLEGLAPLPDPIFVNPGHHLLEVRLDNGTKERREIDAKAGETQDVRIELPPGAPGPVNTPLPLIPARAPVVAPPEEPRRVAAATRRRSVPR